MTAATAKFVRVPVGLLESLVDSGECRFDHHGGCQEHGYLRLQPGEKCPQRELKDIIAETGYRGGGGRSGA